MPAATPPAATSATPCSPSCAGGRTSPCSKAASPSTCWWPGAASAACWSTTTNAAGWPCARPGSCSPPAASAPSTPTRPIRPKPRATGSPWPPAPVRSWPISSSCSSTRRPLPCPAPARSLPLLSEALRGAGALLVDRDGRRFVDELGPRDIVARAVFRERARARQPFLDMRPALAAQGRSAFPTAVAECERAGFDPAAAPVPILPAAHYYMGGVLTDAHGRTSIPGLWACRRGGRERRPRRQPPRQQQPARGLRHRRPGCRGRRHLRVTYLRCRTGPGGPRPARSLGPAAAARRTCRLPPAAGSASSATAPASKPPLPRPHRSSGR